MEDSNSSNMLSIDNEEFTRLQTQLIELRTTNYQLKEESSKASKELNHLQEIHQSTLKELEKANKNIQKSKKAKEYQLLSEENTSLLTRLHTQEEDFKLQNKTLLDEIANVCEENGELKKKLKSSESGGVADNGPGGHTPEIVRLKAENAALQKSLQANRERLNSESGAVDNVDSGSSSNAVTEVTSEEISSLRLGMATLEEERNLLRQQIATMTEREGAHLAEIEGTKKEMERNSEKLRKKQEIVLQLQNEKEKLIAEHKQSIDQVVFDKEQDIERLRSQLSAYEEQAGKINESMKQRAEMGEQLSIARSEKAKLKSKWENISKTLTVITQERDDAKHVLNELSLELESAKQQLQEERVRCQQLQREFSEAKQATEDMADQILSYREDKMKAEEELRSVIKLAENRKSLLDNMAIKEQEIASEQKRKEDELINSYKTKINDLSYQLEVEENKNKELNISLSEALELKEKLKKFEAQKATHEEKVQQLTEKFEAQIKQLQEELEQRETTHAEEMELVRNELSSLETEKKELADRLQTMEDEMNDKITNVKIVEKKSSALIKDLKRQLQQFQKREEKLQQQLLESSTLNISTTSHEEHNHSRESSLSSFKGAGGLDITPNTSMQMAESEIDSEDTQALLDRIADLQQEKWLLEEKVQHLENTGSALAEDVLQKSTIIQHYYMDNKADQAHSVGHLSATPPQGKSLPMRLVPWSKTPSKDSEAMAEVNRKMQRALEEALVKNIHLQKNLDTLSAQLQTDSQPTSPSTPP